MGAAFRAENGVGFRMWLSQGSMARPVHSLSTLRSPDRSGTTQDSVLAAGQLCQVGVATHRVPLQGFRLSMSSILPAQAWPGALPASLEARFKGQGSSKIMDRAGNQQLLGRLINFGDQLPADALEVIRLIRVYGVGLEQEALAKFAE